MSWYERWFLLILVELLTSLNELKWDVILVDIGGIVDHHQYQQKSPLTSIHWVMVNNFTNINKNHLSLQLIEWRQQFHQYQQKSPLTSIHWVMVNNSTNINKNHLSPQLIGWWSTIPPISANITSHLNSLNDGQQFHPMSWGERWFLLILVELLTIIQWVKVRGDVCWYWWNCWPSLNELIWEVILLILVELFTITQWVKVRGDFYWYWWNCWPSFNELKREVIFVDIGGIVDITQWV